MSKLYCGIEDELFFIDNNFASRLTKGKKKRRLKLERVLQTIQSPIGTPKGGVDSFWTNQGGLVYAESTATEFTTPLIEQRQGCITDLVDAVVAGRALAIRMKEDYEELGNRTLLEGFSSHYNFTLDPRLNGRNLNDVKKLLKFENEVVAWDKFTTDIARILIRTLGPAYFALLEDDVSSGFMYRIREGNRFELCGDYMPDIAQLKAGLTFVYGTLNGMQRIIKETVQARVRSNFSEHEVFDKLTEHDIYVQLPIVLENMEYRKITSKKGLGASREFSRAMAKEGLDLKLDTTCGLVVTPKDILNTYLDFFEADIAAIATKEEMALLREIIEDNVYSLQLEIPGYQEFYFDISEEYLVDETGKTDEEIIAAHRPQKRTAEIYSMFAKDQDIEFGDYTLIAKKFTWNQLSFEVKHGRKSVDVVIERDNVIAFIDAINNADIKTALSYRIN